MADTKQKPTLAVGFNLPTAIRAMLPNGRLLSSDGSVWLVRKAPLQPIADAKSVSDRIEAFLPLLAAYEELAVMAPVNMTRRAVARKSYRQTHMLLVNTPKVYVPQQGNKNSAFLKEVFPQEITEQRVLMLAVRLVDKIGGDGGMKAAVDSIVETLVAGNTPMSDFDTDERKVDAALARCGFSVPNQAEIHMANSWWNQGRFPDTVSLPHSDHMHIFSDTAAARMADDAGRNDCANWPHIPSHRSLTLAVLENFDFSFLSPSEVFANWAVGLLADGAVAISIRGSIEPAKVTRAELRRQRKRYLDDINERFQHGKMELAEQTEMEDVLRDVEDIYATQGGSPTIVDASVLVAFDGEVEDISTAGAGTSAQLRVMNLRQSQAMAEMMLCSHIRANPVLHDMPSQNIACSGIQSLSMVGDRTGALLGFTQRDRQPVLFDPKASTNEDVGPIAVHVGSTGSGKAIEMSQSLPTPSGWTTMRELEVGSKVIGRDGKPATVTYLAPIEDKPDLFRITFSDGQTIDADGNHQWVVAGWHDAEHLLAMSRILRAEAESTSAQSVTAEVLRMIVESLIPGLWSTHQGMDASLRMLDVPESPMYDVAPTLSALALRLVQMAGDGSMAAGEAVMSTGEILDAGHRALTIRPSKALDLPDIQLDEDPAAYGARFAAGAEPEVAYLRAGANQRTALLEGIVQALGGGIVLELPTAAHAAFTAELLRSLGKLAMLQESSVTLMRDSELGIESIESIDPVPARCITVDSPDSTYLVGGFIPTHNTQMLLWKAVQYDNLGIPQIFVDPKTGSDHSQTIENVGGHVTSLDELASADGIFDPIRFSSTAAVGVELAVSMLSSIDPWGGEAKKFEVDLYRALSYGVNHGAQCIGEALDLAQKAKWANEALCQPIFRLAESSPTFRACVGIYPNGEALRVADGLTYIKTGGMHLELPEPGAMASASLTQRIGMALVRMMVFGSLMALEGRGGVIHLDEAWVFLGAGKDEVQRLGRLARSQNVTAELYTQRISDALEAKLDGYISRGTILPTADEFEARAALALFHIEATDDRVAAITAKGTIGGVDSVTPNWNSMRALRDPDTRRVLRGTIGIVSDLAGRAVPVHIKLPEVFLKLSSTTPSDIAARKKALAVMNA